MYVVIDSECNVIPERATLLTSEGNALLNFYVALIMIHLILLC